MRATLALLCLAALCTASKKRRQHSDWDDRTDMDKVNTRSCANLTTVLDNWKFAIMTQVKDLLLNDHNTVLPDYGRIQSLSDALGDLYKEFNVLKERLGELTNKFDGVEAFVDDMQAGRGPSTPRREPTAPQTSPERAPRTRIVLRRVKKPRIPEA
ncbi:uncharacterized protein LOC136749826 [Amia ocellicauda]|uniref:uncharacterized protein LOC136749826 n=1 Tax=Amia ocellicauda TaxID=2972642 RepID=UPI003463E264